ncbi:MAG: hypothetical protein LRZ98_00685 [Candidatus Pacebacteria bacterium]|nr:hypothetical protein [Candidatus Paceibacterota bacterium]
MLILEISTMVLGFPAIDPPTNTLELSLSTLTITNPLIVFLSDPILPGIFFPFHTLPGVVPAPIEPTSLSACLFPCDLLPPAKPHLLTPP